MHLHHNINKHIHHHHCHQWFNASLPGEPTLASQPRFTSAIYMLWCKFVATDTKKNKIPLCYSLL